MNKHFETLALGVICTIFVLSMHQSCSNSSKKNENQEKTEIKKVQKLKDNVINTRFIRQR